MLRLILLTIAALGAGLAPGQTNPTQRVVSGSLASDEILAALFPDAPKSIVLSPLVDNPKFSNISSQVKDFPERWHNSAESLLALKPSLVILASYNNPVLKTRVRESGITVLELKDFNTIDDIRDNIRAIGTATNRKGEAEKLVSAFDNRLDAIQTKKTSEKNRPLLIAYSASAMPGGKNTLTDAMIRAAGGRNLAAEKGIAGWTRVNSEIIATMQPDFILVPIEDSDTDKVVQSIRNDPLWRNMRAVQGGKFVFIAQSAFGAVSHHLATAIEAVAKGIENFKPTMAIK